MRGDASSWIRVSCISSTPIRGYTNHFLLIHPRFEINRPRTVWRAFLDVRQYYSSSNIQETIPCNQFPAQMPLEDDYYIYLLSYSSRGNFSNGIQTKNLEILVVEGRPTPHCMDQKLGIVCLSWDYYIFRPVLCSLYCLVCFNVLLVLDAWAQSHSFATIVVVLKVSHSAPFLFGPIRLHIEISLTKLGAQVARLQRFLIRYSSRKPFEYTCEIATRQISSFSELKYAKVAGLSSKPQIFRATNYSPSTRIASQSPRIPKWTIGKWLGVITVSAIVLRIYFFIICSELLRRFNLITKPRKWSAERLVLRYLYSSSESPSWGDCIARLIFISISVSMKK